jgi:hypothetical protein
MRVVIIDVLIVLAPLALILWIHPRFERITAAWWRLLLGQLIIQLLQLVALRLGNTLVTEGLLDKRPATGLAAVLFGIGTIAAALTIEKYVGQYAGGSALGLLRVAALRQVLGGARASGGAGAATAAAGGVVAGTAIAAGPGGPGGPPGGQLGSGLGAAPGAPSYQPSAGAGGVHAQTVAYPATPATATPAGRGPGTPGAAQAGSWPDPAPDRGMPPDDARTPTAPGARGSGRHD